LILILLKQLIYSNIRNQAEEITTLEILVLKRMNEEGFRMYTKRLYLAKICSENYVIGRCRDIELSNPTIKV